VGGRFHLRYRGGPGRARPSGSATSPSTSSGSSCATPSSPWASI
jgi:hypothetical protein